MSLKGVAKATLSILDSGGYTTDSGVSINFARELDQAVSGTRLYAPTELQALSNQPSGTASGPRIEVCNETTQAEARRHWGIWIGVASGVGIPIAWMVILPNSCMNGGLIFSLLALAQSGVGLIWLIVGIISGIMLLF